MNIAQAKTIPIPSYLSHRGVSPAFQRRDGSEFWYHSPLRGDDKTPSFKVHVPKNIWFDYGINEGGNLIKLVSELERVTVNEVLRHLDRTGLFSASHAVPAPATKQDYAAKQQKLSAAGQKEKLGSLEVVKQEPITDPQILGILANRKIDLDIARKYCAQIHFTGPQSVQTHIALGYPAGDGFETRSGDFYGKSFKGFVGKTKDITIHAQTNADTAQVFEGFTDYLAYLTHFKDRAQSATVIVLNSVVMWERALMILQDRQISTVRLYLDNDAAGDATTNSFLKALPSKRVLDMRLHYAGHKDLGDWHQATFEM